MRQIFVFSYPRKNEYLFGPENESHEDENPNFFIAIDILPSFERVDVCGERRGFIQEKKSHKAQDFEKAYFHVNNYFFSHNSKYDEEDFDHCFDMPRVVLHRILARFKEKVCSNDDLIARERRVYYTNSSDSRASHAYI